MAFLNIPNVSMRGIVSCVPSRVVSNLDYSLDKETLDRFISTIGVKEKHIADCNVCSSDLCFVAAEKLLESLKWEKEDINFLIFVSQTPDYITPATSCILQNRLGLSKECYTQDINLGCSGWVYGLSVICSLISLNRGKGLLLVGDTISKIISENDKSTWLLFGDAGTATAIEYDEDTENMMFHMATDGSGAENIIVKDGGFRNGITDDSFVQKKMDEGVCHSNMELSLDGMNVFTFGLSQAPKSIKALSEHFKIDLDSIDYFIFHQANLFMNEKIRKKLGIEKEKVPYTLMHYGNTSCASVPLTINSQFSGINATKKKILACAFGVGLSWGSVYFTIDNFVCPKIIEY